MVDFTKMEVGMIRTTDNEGIFIIRGKMFGPFNPEELGTINRFLDYHFWFSSNKKGANP